LQWESQENDKTPEFELSNGTQTAGQYHWKVERGRNKSKIIQSKKSGCVVKSMLLNLSST